MHVSGTLLLTQQGRDGLQRELRWVLEHPGNGTLGPWACVRDSAAHPNCDAGRWSWAHHHGCFIEENPSSSRDHDTIAMTTGKPTHANFQHENLTRNTQETTED